MMVLVLNWLPPLLELLEEVLGVDAVGVGVEAEEEGILPVG